MSFLIHMITYLFSAPIAKVASGYLVSYAGITPAFVPVCIEMTSYAMVRPVNYLFVHPFMNYISKNLKLITFKKTQENKDDFILISEISS